MSRRAEQASGTSIERTVEFWQRRASRVLTGEDAREIVQNTTGFFRVLAEWEAGEAQRRTEAETDQGGPRAAATSADSCPEGGEV